MDEFAPIYGYASVKHELAQIADFLKHPECYGDVGSRMPAGLLLDGEPGVGKTLMANCLMAASGLPSFTVRKNQRADDMLEAIKATFAEAVEKAPAIILLDDMDKFSNSDFRLRDTQEYVTVQACMDEVKGKGVFVIATTNCSGKLPKSLVREGRFDRIIRLQAPYGDDAMAIVEHYLEGKACALDVSAADVADIISGRSCAFLETVINEASLLAGFERVQAVTLEHFIRAYARIDAHGSLSVPDASREPACLADAWATERCQVAFHEAGHIVVQEALHAGSAAVAVLVDQQGKIAGLAKTRLENAGHMHEDVRGNILVALAGVLAVEMKYGVPCMGSGDDQLKACSAAKNLLTSAAYLGPYYAMYSEHCTSDSLSENTEQACAIVVEQCRWDARALLARNWDAVERIAAMLYANGYVLASDIAQVMS